MNINNISWMIKTEIKQKYVAKKNIVYKLSGLIYFKGALDSKSVPKYQEGITYRSN